MSNRPSLMEQAGISDPEPRTAAPRGGFDAHRVKIAAAVGLVVIAAGVLAWTTGLIGGRGAPKVDAKVAEERRERLDEEVKQEQARQERLGVPPVESGG